MHQFFRKNTVLLCLITLCVFSKIDGADAACTPGIPCVDYDIYSNADAARDASLNALKSGVPAPYEETACDANFMNQIYANAHMQASREVIMAQQLIHKPDSVLEYTCFDNRIKATANHAGKPFSEDDTLFVERQVCLSSDDQAFTDGTPPTCPVDTTLAAVSGTIDLSALLQDFLMDNLQTYVDSNFSHTFMGEAISIDNDMDYNIPDDDNYSYECTHMSTIWNIAKCVDFGEDDRFRSFNHLVNFDPRTIPVACSPGNESDAAIEASSDPTKLDSTEAGVVSDGEAYNQAADSAPNPCPASGSAVGGVNTGFSNDLIRLANNCDDGANTNPYASFDMAELYDEITKGIGEYVDGAGTSTGDVVCSDPIPTGLPVISYFYGRTPALGVGFNFRIIGREAELHYDHICPNPGCFYDPNPSSYTVGDPIPPYPGTPSGQCVDNWF